jgi:phosphoserine aminotransferase
MMTLTEIGTKFNTDKAAHHKYTYVYDELLSHMRNSSINVLEVGILNGASILMWNEYFSNAKIYGVDINPHSHLNSSRITTIVANQEKEEDLLKLPDNLHLIIDDGGHTMLQQQITLKVMFKKLSPAGIYILEDLHTSLPEFYRDYGSNEYNNSIKLLNDLKNKKLSEDSQYHITSTEFDELLAEIDSIEIIENSSQSITSIIRKRDQ